MAGNHPLNAPDYQALFESAPGLYLVLTPDLEIVAVSEAYLKATMTVRKDILGRNLFEVFPDNPNDPGATGARNLRLSLERVITTGRADTMAVQKYDIRRPEAEGGDFEVRFWSPVNSPVAGGDGKLRYIIHRVEDVTEFVRLREAGREREQAVESLRAQTGQMETEIYLRAQQLAETNRQLHMANEVLARLYDQIALLMSQADDEFEPKAAVDSSGTMTSAEMLSRVGRLIANHKRLEQQLRHSQKMEAIGRLAGGVAHDFNNLLTVIAGYAGLLHMQVRNSEGAMNITEIQEAVAWAAALTRQLLAFSRQQVRQPRVLDLNAVVTGIQGMLRRVIGENVSLLTVLASGLDKVKADRGQIEQVIMNLVVNARDAMPAGGRLVIETRNVEAFPGDEPAPAPWKGRAVLLSVSDTGTGMDSATLARIFEPFFTTKELGKGTGLGLSIVHGIVEQSGGQLTVRSEPGAGSSFDIYLPVTSECDEAPAAGPAVLGAPPLGTVLIVEDEPPLRDLLRRVVTGGGHQVLSAANGLEALTLVTHFPERIDVVLTDVVMPGMTGPELAARLQIVHPQTRVLFMSGYDRELVKAETLAHAAGFLPKPFTPEQLLEQLSILLAARNLRGNDPDVRVSR